MNKKIHVNLNKKNTNTIYLDIGSQTSSLTKPSQIRKVIIFYNTMSSIRSFTIANIFY